MPDHNDQALRAAITRLLACEAQRTDGRLTVSNLAAEAGLTRQQAYRSPVIYVWREATREPPSTSHPDKTQARIERLARELAAAQQRAQRYRQERDAARDRAKTLANACRVLDEETRHYEPRSPTPTSSCRSVIGRSRGSPRSRRRAATLTGECLASSRERELLPRSRSPIWAQRRQIAPLGVRPERRLAVIVRGAPAVLVGDLAPTPVLQRTGGDDPERLERVDPLLADGAQVRPVVAHVEGIEKLLVALQATQPHVAREHRSLRRVLPRDRPADAGVV